MFNPAHPVTSASTYSMAASLCHSFDLEQLDATADTGPVDSMDEGPIEDAYDLFYGASPLSSPCPSPAASRPSTPPPSTCPVEDVAEGSKRRCTSFEEPVPKRPALDAARKTTSKMRRDRAKARSQRRARRREERRQDIESTRMPAHAAAAKHVAPSQEEATAYNAKNIPSASTGYIATPDSNGRVYTLGELVCRGFKVIEWDGRHARPITDSDGRVVAVLAGQPADEGWRDVHEGAFRLLHDASLGCDFTKKSAAHRRGNFPALNAGISFGGGQMKPGNLYHSRRRSGILEGLTASPNFQRIAGFASSAFATWMPDLHAYYVDHFEQLLAHDSMLRRNFHSSTWAAAAFNFGPQTVTAKHRDYANLPFGMCSVTALGDYNPKYGGHIVLWDLELVVEFPPGSTVLIPSAAVAHSNTPIQNHERRSSFTQYSAGGLFRWVDHGFQLDAAFMKKLSAAEQQELTAGNRARCKMGLSLLPTLATLRGRYQ